MIGTSIIFEPVWDRVKEFLHIVEYSRDGGHPDPRIRIEFLDVPETLAREVVLVVMPCVQCLRPIHPLRRRVGDEWERLFYSPTCLLTTRMSCSRGRAVELEYQRFKGLMLGARPSSQLALF